MRLVIAVYPAYGGKTWPDCPSAPGFSFPCFWLVVHQPQISYPEREHIACRHSGAPVLPMRGSCWAFSSEKHGMRIWGHYVENRVAHKVWKNSIIGGGWIFFIFRGAVFWLLAFRLVQYFVFTELACTSSSLFYFRHYGEHETGLPIKSEKIPLSGEVEIFSFFRGAVFWLLAFGLVRSFDFTELACPDGWALIPYTSKLTDIDAIMMVNQQSATDMRIAVQYESGWNFSWWVVGVEKGNCDHYKVCVGTYVHVYVVWMKWCYLTYRITIFEDSVWYVHLTHSICMMILRRHTKDGYGSAFSLKTRQIHLTNYVCWISKYGMDQSCSCCIMHKK